MKYCQYCGKQIDDDSDFCTYCGSNLKVHKVTSYGVILSGCITKVKALTCQLFRKAKRPKIQFKSSCFSGIKKWGKRVLIASAVLAILCLLTLLGIWLYGVYKTSTWTKEDERREAIAMNDIRQADHIARTLFKEYAEGSHWYLDYSCNYDHIKRGIAIIRNAAEKGNAQAQFTLGCIYGGARYDRIDPDWDDYTMMHSTPDNERAAYWYNQAAIQNHSMAMNNLGEAYRYGKGVEKDLIKASDLIRKSAELGNKLAQLNYGDMFRDGEVRIIYVSDSISGKIYYRKLLPDIETAKEWWIKAMENGNDNAKERLEKIY